MHNPKLNLNNRLHEQDQLLPSREKHPKKAQAKMHMLGLTVR